MVLKTRQLLQQWLEVVIKSNCKYANFKEQIKSIKNSDFTFQDLFTVVLTFFSDTLFQDETTVYDSPDLVLNFFTHNFHYWFPTLCIDDKFNSFIKQASCKANVDENECLQHLWGWLIIFSLMEVGETTSFFEDISLDVVTNLQVFMYTSFIAIVNPESTLKMDDTEKSLTLCLGSEEITQVSPEKVLNLSHDKEVPRNQKNIITREELLQRAVDLHKENSDFYMRLRDAEKELKKVYETNCYLESEIQKKEEKIIELNECVQKTRDIEIDTAAHLFTLKKALKAEQTLTSRLREKTASLQLQLFGFSSNTGHTMKKKDFTPVSLDICLLKKASSVSYENTIQRLLAETQRHILTIKRLEKQFKDEISKGVRKQTEIEDLKKELLIMTCIKAERHHFENELIAQQAANMTQFQIIHDLNQKTSELEIRLEEMNNLNYVPVNAYMNQSLENDLKSKVDDLLKERTTLLTELESLRSCHVSHNENSLYKKQLDLASETIQRLQTELACCQVDADKYKSTADFLRHTSEDKSKTREFESKELRNKVESLQTLVKTLESELETLRQESREWALIKQRHLEEHQADSETITLLRSENTLILSEIEEMRIKNQEKQNKICHLEDYISSVLEPQKEKLSCDIQKLEEANAVLIEKVKVKTFLMTEKEEQLSIETTALKTTQRRVCELESEMKANGEVLETYRKRLQIAEENLRNKKNLTAQLRAQMENDRKSCNDLEMKLQNTTDSLLKLKKNYTDVESQYMMKMDECKQMELKLSFYRVEFERLSHCAMNPMQNSEITREGPCRQLLQEIRSQISAGKHELELLGQNIEKRLAEIPRSTGDHNEFQIEDIVEHFEKEKVQSAAKLRTITLRLTEAEDAYSKLLREYQGLGNTYTMLLQQYTDLEKKKASKQCTPKGSLSPSTSIKNEDVLISNPINKDMSMKVTLSTIRTSKETHQDNNSKHKSYVKPSQRIETHVETCEAMLRNDTTTLPSRPTSEMFDTIGTVSEAASSFYGSPHISGSSSPVMSSLPYETIEGTTSIDLACPSHNTKINTEAIQPHEKSPNPNKRSPPPKIIPKPPSISKMNHLVESSSQPLRRQVNLIKNEAPVIRKSIQRYSLRSSIQNPNEQKNELVTKRKSIIGKTSDMKCKEFVAKSTLPRRTSVSSQWSTTEQSTLATNTLLKPKFLVKEHSFPHFQSSDTIQNFPEKRNFFTGRKSLAAATNPTSKPSLPLLKSKSISQPKQLASVQSLLMKPSKSDDEDTQEERAQEECTLSQETPTGEIQYNDSQTKRLMLKQQSNEFEKDMLLSVAHINRKQPQIAPGKKKFAHNSSFSGLRVNPLKSSKNISNFF
ncbi:kinectin-like isoform X2 [Hylaeus volcanicus]|uniref:kinectin-like isoform X2 n=1 Tax=Hylaeus volcanicus TaxID=313075 RepID=UPI0023B7F1DB|nr:kinectin-like isoform X2 [Hylaeus volcanicus]